MSADYRLVPHGRGADPLRLGRRPASGSTATATAGSRGRVPRRRRRFRPPRPRPRQGAHRGRFRLLGQRAGALARRDRVLRGSIATAAARSRARSSTRSSRPPTAAARASCRSPTCKRRSHRRRRRRRRRLGPSVEGHARPRPLPPGDRLASAGAEARRVRARLHLEDQRRQGRDHPLEAGRPQARRPGLRQLHLRAVPQPVGQHREAVPPVQGPRDLRDGLRPRGPSRPTAGGWRATTASARSPRSRKPTKSGSTSRKSAAGSSTSVSRCSSTRSTTPSAPATAACPAAST